MSNDDWKKAEQSLSWSYLSWSYGKVEMKIDGYNVTIVVEPLKALKNVLVVYVNDKLKCTWLSEDCEERRRFFQKHTKNLLSRKEQKRLAREKKAVREAVGKTTYEWYSPYWTSFRSLKSHLIKNNKSIELMEVI